MTGTERSPRPAAWVWLAVVALSVCAYTLGMERVARMAEAAGQAREERVFAQSLRGRVIVIDPGHGGVDPGAISSSGLEEAGLNLRIATMLGEMLQAAGATVIYTRSDENDLSGAPAPSEELTPRGTPEPPGPGAAPPPGTIDYRERKVNDLRARMELIEAVRPDLVVSVHCNAADSSQWRGAQTFFDGPPGPRRDASRALAADVQHALREFTATNRWANSGIGHLILDRSPSPAITVEAGFLSNPEEARLLASPEYQRRVAFAVFLGIARWSAGVRVNDPTAITGPLSIV